MREINDASIPRRRRSRLFGVTLSVGFAVEFVKSLDRGDLADEGTRHQAGTTAEGSRASSCPARTAGSSIDAVAAGDHRMSKAAVEAQDPATKLGRRRSSDRAFGEGLRSNLKPDEIFELVARRLGEYSDGIGKNAVSSSSSTVRRRDEPRARGDRGIGEARGDRHERAGRAGEQAHRRGHETQDPRGAAHARVPAPIGFRGSRASSRPSSRRARKAGSSLRRGPPSAAPPQRSLGLNDSDAQRFKKGLQAAQEQVVEFKAHIDVSRQHDLLAGLVQPINMIEASFMRANAQGAAAAGDDQRLRRANTMTRRLEPRARGRCSRPGRSRSTSTRPSGQTDSAYARMLADATREFTTAQAQQALGADRLTSAEKKLLELEADPKWKRRSRRPSRRTSRRSSTPPR
jgi:hypothetical protein